jgi:predicted transcriptional regulator
VLVRRGAPDPCHLVFERVGCSQNCHSGCVMKLSEIKDILKADILVGEHHRDKTVAAAGGADMMEDVLSAVAEGGVLLTGLTTDQVLRTAKITGLAAIVIVRGKKPDKSLLDLAKTYDVPVLLTEYSLFVACGRLYMNGLRGLDGSW